MKAKINFQSELLFGNWKKNETSITRMQNAAKGTS